MRLSDERGVVVETTTRSRRSHGRIVFTSRRDGNNEIYVMDADGGNRERLTDNPANDFDPDWSPDGTKIAFASADETATSIKST